MLRIKVKIDEKKIKKEMREKWKKRTKFFERKIKRIIHILKKWIFFNIYDKRKN